MTTDPKCLSRLLPPRRGSCSIPLLLAVAAMTAACGEKAAPVTSDPNFYKVSREDLPITVKEAGELQAVRETSVRSQVEGQATILYLIPEGSNVKVGEKLFELDVSEIVEKRANQKITVEKARNAWEQARTAADILEKELTTKLNSAASQLRIAEMELEKLLGATGDKANEGTNGDMLKRLRELVSEKPVTAAPVDAALQEEEGAPRTVKVAAVDPRTFANLVDKTLQLLQVPGGGDPLKRDMGDMANRILDQADKIRLAMADLSIKGDKVAYSRRLASKQFITRNELEGDELAYQSQISQVTLAWNRLDQLINYDLPVERIKAAQDYENAQLEMQRVEASNDAERKKSSFDVDAKKQELDVAAERLANFNKQIENAIVYAPTPGLVVYARVDRDRRGGEAVREGVSVRERQEIIVLPDNTKMRCIVKVQEAQIDKVAVGQRAFVSVEAFPNEILPGRVVRVAPVADSSSSWMGNDKKVYTTVVELDGENNDSRLRSRMAAAAAITIDTVPDVIAVPQQSVRRDRSVNYIWKHTGKGPEAVKVVVGEHNQEKVQILEGVDVGDIV
ncbi:MAG: efflux RND transporter periplasmic adaptor subunit, partial [Planctomycetes bacterium]|nr:efflux RND transporter periplasmic adaptor subunit [Planctomycetota bacterium]